MSDLTEKIWKFKWLLRKRKHQKFAGKGLEDTSSGQGRILALLKMQDSISTREMTYLLGMHYSSLNEMLGKLEKNGYIIREASTDDKRISLVKLTEKGRATEQNGKEENDLFSCLTGKEQQIFGEYLDRLNAALQSQLGYNDADLKNWKDEMKSHRHEVHGIEKGIREMVIRKMHKHMHDCGHDHEHKRSKRCKAGDEHSKHLRERKEKDCKNNKAD